MTVIRRGRNSYHYVSERLSGRVATHYCGAGPEGERWAGRWADLLEEVREVRSKGRAERASLRAADGIVGEIAREARELAVLAMTAAGYHRPKGSWRRRRWRRNPVGDERGELAVAGLQRDAAEKFEAFYESVSKGGPGAEAKVRRYFEVMRSAAPGTPLMAKLIEAHGGDPAKVAEEELIARYAGDDLIRREATRLSLERFRSDLAGPGPVSAIERVLIGRAAVCWLASYDAEARAARTAFVAEGVRTPAEADFFQKTADRTSRRLLDVLKALHLVRRALPSLKLSLAVRDGQSGSAAVAVVETDPARDDGDRMVGPREVEADPIRSGEGRAVGSEASI